MPKVTLLSYSVPAFTEDKDPLTALLAAISIMHEADPIAYATELSRREKEFQVNEILKSRLRGALEFMSFDFLVEGVSRAFTHQLVRHRKFHFSQQSLRFFKATKSGFGMPRFKKNEQGEEYETLIAQNVQNTMDTYSKLLEKGCPTEDARSILPTNVLTAISFGCTLRDLIEMAEIRLCIQTQSEFRSVMVLIKDEIRKKCDPFIANKLIIDCQRTGHCSFKSVFDRHCPIEKTLPTVQKKIAEQNAREKEYLEEMKQKTGDKNRGVCLEEVAACQHNGEIIDDDGRQLCMTCMEYLNVEAVKN